MKSQLFPNPRILVDFAKRLVFVLFTKVLNFSAKTNPIRGIGSVWIRFGEPKLNMSAYGWRWCTFLKVWETWSIWFERSFPNLVISPLDTNENRTVFKMNYTVFSSISAVPLGKSITAYLSSVFQWKALLLFSPDSEKLDYRNTFESVWRLGLNRGVRICLSSVFGHACCTSSVLFFHKTWWDAYVSIFTENGHTLSRWLVAKQSLFLYDIGLFATAQFQYGVWRTHCVVFYTKHFKISTSFDFDQLHVMHMEHLHKNPYLIQLCVQWRTSQSLYEGD